MCSGNQSLTFNYDIRGNERKRHGGGVRRATRTGIRSKGKMKTKAISFEREECFLLCERIVFLFQSGKSDIADSCTIFIIPGVRKFHGISLNQPFIIISCESIVSMDHNIVPKRYCQLVEHRTIREFDLNDETNLDPFLLSSLIALRR